MDNLFNNWHNNQVNIFKETLQFRPITSLSGQSHSDSLWTIIRVKLLLVMMLYMIVRELFDLYVFGKQYFLSIENWISLSLITVVAFVLYAANIHSFDCKSPVTNI